MNGETKELVTRTLVVTPSGALSPGLLSASAVAVGINMGALGGLLVALGHTAFELPYVFLLTKLMGKIRAHLTKLQKPLSLLVFAFALFFAWGLLGPASMPEVSVSNAFVAGFVFTAFNFYFLLWWATVGLPLVELASNNAKSFAVMYASHVWMDYVWLVFLASLGNAISLLGYMQYLNYALAAMLVLFALDILLKSFVGKGIIP